MNSSIGSRIKSLRTSLGISQAELAEKLGFRSKSSITKIEQCQRELPLKYVEPLAKALGRDSVPFASRGKAYLCKPNGTRRCESCVY